MYKVCVFRCCNGTEEMVKEIGHRPMGKDTADKKAEVMNRAWRQNPNNPEEGELYARAERIAV